MVSNGCISDVFRACFNPGYEMAYNNGQDEAREYLMKAGTLLFRSVGSFIKHLTGKTSASEYRL